MGYALTLIWLEGNKKNEKQWLKSILWRNPFFQLDFYTNPSFNTLRFIFGGINMEKKIEDLEFKLDSEEVLKNSFEIKEGDNTITYLGTVKNLNLCGCMNAPNKDCSLKGILFGEVYLERYDHVDFIEKVIREYPATGKTEVVDETRSEINVDDPTWSIGGEFKEQVHYVHFEGDLIHSNLTLSQELIDKVFKPINETLARYCDKIRELNK